MERLDIPAYLLNWMRAQSQSMFLGDMLQEYYRHGGLTDPQLVQAKIRYIQAGNDIPPKTK